MGSTIVSCEQCTKRRDEEIPENIVSQLRNNTSRTSKTSPKELYHENRPIFPRSSVNDDCEDKTREPQVNPNIFSQYIQTRHLWDDCLGSMDYIKNISTDRLWTLREIPKNKVKDGKSLEQIQNNLTLLNQLDHPNITKNIEYYEDEKSYYLINEYVDEYLLNKDSKDKVIYCEFIVKFIMYHLFSVLDYLHEHSIIYGQVNAKNIGFQYIGLIDKNSKIKSISSIFREINQDNQLQEELMTVQDLNKLKEKTKNTVRQLGNYQLKLLDCGINNVIREKKNVEIDIKENNKDYNKSNLNYCSPECLKGGLENGMDEWACGILMIYLLTGIFPFDSNDSKRIYNNIKNSGPIDLKKENYKNISDFCKSLICELLVKDNTKRIDSKGALEKNFFKKGIEIKDLYKIIE